MELERYRDLAFGTALSLLGDYHRAEDAVQEAFVEALRCWDRLENPEARGAWLRGIVRHRCFRILRRRDLETAPLFELTGGDEPWEKAARAETHSTLLQRVRALPRPLREVVVLHYLRGCPQKEVAAFLDLPATTVNNRLHRARQLLKGEPAMNFETIESGTVLRAAGGIVDVRFAPDAVPDVFDALAPASAKANLRVAQVLDDGVVRCQLVGGTPPDVGQNVINRTAHGGTYSAAVADDAAIAATVATLGQEQVGMRETGIKPVDLFCPLPERGNIGLFGTAGVGKMVMALELTHRLPADGPVLFYFGDRSEPALVRDLQEEGQDFARNIWLLSERATDPEFARDTDLFDARIYCSPLLAIRNLWPATDPFHSASVVAVGERHARLAAEARAAILRSREIQQDPTLLEYLACRSIAAARRRLARLDERVATLPPEERRSVERARRLEAFLTTPFYVAEDFNGLPGVTVPLEATLDGVESILAGDHDDTPVEELRFIGELPA